MLLRLAGQLNTRQMIDLQGYLLEAVPNGVIRDSREMNDCIHTVEHVIRHAADISEVLDIKAAFRQYVAVADECSVIARIETGKKRAREARTQVFNHDGPYIAHVAGYQYFHLTVPVHQIMHL